mmetsp:Transcript_73687/g.139166  ORF Transcript_73687/g.139166 Transcript_73687/m.139166 type:complete len:83 (+) Transcript_73687:766-1014(+)
MFYQINRLQPAAPELISDETPELQWEGLPREHCEILDPTFDIARLIQSLENLHLQSRRYLVVLQVCKCILSDANLFRFPLHQ